jgi:hypothetical protein
MSPTEIKSLKDKEIIDIQGGPRVTFAFSSN